MIAFREATLRYAGQTRPAVEGVTLDVPRGVLTAIVGPNGSGKSTLVRALLGRVPLVSGDVLIAGIPIRSLPRAAMARQVAVVAQREDTVFPIRVDEYVSLGRHPHRGAWSAPAAADREAVQNALAVADVAQLADRRTDTLSGGEFQRVRIARAVAQDTDALIVLDEPTTFLDVAHEMACFELLVELSRRNKAVLVVSHQLNLVARFADRVVLLSAGRCAATGTPDDVMRGEILESVYHWPLVVSRDPAVGAPTLVPLRQRRSLHT